MGGKLVFLCMLRYFFMPSDILIFELKFRSEINSLSWTFSEIIISPLSSKLIKFLSNRESYSGDSKIPFSTSNLSSLFECLHGTIWLAINISSTLIPVTFLTSSVKKMIVYKELRDWEKPSDHVPVVIEVDV